MREGLKTNIFKGKYEAKLEFLEELCNELRWDVAEMQRVEVPVEWS